MPNRYRVPLRLLLPNLVYIAIVIVVGSWHWQAGVCVAVALLVCTLVYTCLASSAAADRRYKHLRP